MLVSAYALERSAYAFADVAVPAAASSSAVAPAAVGPAPVVPLNVIGVDPGFCRIFFNDCDLQPLVFEVGNEGFVRVFERDLPLPKREGYAFGGWYMDDLRKTPFLESDEPYRVFKGGEFALFPLWTKLQPDPDPPTPVPDPDPGNPADRPFPNNLDAPFGIAETASHGEAGAEQEASDRDDSERAPVGAEPSGQAERGPSAQNAGDGLERGFEEGLSPVVAEEAPVLGVALLAVLGTAFLALSASIALDIRVLIWYASKKKAVQSESGVGI